MFHVRFGQRLDLFECTIIISECTGSDSLDYSATYRYQFMLLFVVYHVTTDIDRVKVPRARSNFYAFGASCVSMKHARA